MMPNQQRMSDTPLGSCPPKQCQSLKRCIEKLPLRILACPGITSSRLPSLPGTLLVSFLLTIRYYRMSANTYFFHSTSGQDIYYSTHQFFLSEQSLYIFVFDLTKPLEDSRIEFWYLSSLFVSLRLVINKAFNNK